jgi:hypothetical protein
LWLPATLLVALEMLVAAQAVDLRKPARERGLARAGWTPEDRRGQPIELDQAAQWTSRTDELVLTDDFVERARPQAGCQRCVLSQPIGGCGREQVVAHSELSTCS